MKKIKLLTFLFIAIVAGFILSSNVFAFEEGEYIGRDYEEKNSKKILEDAIIFDGEKHDYGIANHYTIYQAYDEPYYIYCIDPERWSGGEYADLYVKRVLDRKNPIDATLLYILDYGNWEDYDYVDRTLALRALVPFVTSDYSNFPGADGDWNARAAVSNANSGIKWASADGNRDYMLDILLYQKEQNCQDSKSRLDSLLKDPSQLKHKSLSEFLGGGKSCNGSNRSKYNTQDKFIDNGKGTLFYLYFDYSYSSRTKNDKILNESVPTVKRAKDLFTKAIKYGSEVAKNGGSDDLITFSTPEFATAADDNGQREITFTANFKDFSKNNSDPINIVITPDTGGKVVTVSQEYRVAGSTGWTKFDDNTDFRSVVQGKANTQVEFKITAKAKANNGEFTINFKIAPTYNDPENRIGAFIYNTRLFDTQRFYIHDYETGDHEPFEVTLKWEDRRGWCIFEGNYPNKDNYEEYRNYIKKCCRDNETGFSLTKACADSKNSNSIYCQLKDKYCDECNTKITVPAMCTEFALQEYEKGKIAEIKGPENITACVLNFVDDTNKNEYQLTKVAAVNNNRYCTVSCKEDYQFDLPTGKYVISGRYFSIQMKAASTRTCYTDEIQLDKFYDDMDAIKDVIAEYEATDDHHKNTSKLKSALSDQSDYIQQIQQCSTWQQGYNYKPDPIITFTYEEEYIQKVLHKENIQFQKANDTYSSASSHYCTGDNNVGVSSDYEKCVNGSWEYKDKEEQYQKATNCHTIKWTETEKYYENGEEKEREVEKSNEICDIVNEEKTRKIPQTRFLKVENKFAADYSPRDYFYTKYSTGVVETDKGGNKQYTKLEKNLASKVGGGTLPSSLLPVSLKDDKGVYTFGIKFKNVGEFFNSNEYGRLIGSKNSVALVNHDTEFKGTYVCAYVVNCPECKITTCEGDDCDKCVDDYANGIICNPYDCPECELTPGDCVGTCIFDNPIGELYSVHQVSLSNFNPTDRQLGANLTTEKGQAMIAEITEKGETVYSEPEYSFTFTPAVISFLRNDINGNSTNGYLGEASKFDMKCKLYSEIVKKPELKGTEKDYTVCQSSVLDELASSTYNAIDANDLADTRKKIESWLDSEHCKKNTCVVVGAIGPAWK